MAMPFGLFGFGNLSIALMCATHNLQSAICNLQ
jgi:hypothetical protein